MLTDIEIAQRATPLPIDQIASRAGIAPEYLPTIFEPGFSTKINFETGKVSRGLGLSLVKDIVEEELGGVISVKSQNGCTDFTIRIPRKNLEVER